MREVVVGCEVFRHPCRPAVQVRRNSQCAEAVLLAVVVDERQKGKLFAVVRIVRDRTVRECCSAFARADHERECREECPGNGECQWDHLPRLCSTDFHANPPYSPFPKGHV